MPTERELLHVLRHVRRRLDQDVSLDALSARAGWSPFHLHCAFRRLVGETPKQYTLRLRPGGAPWESYITDPADHPDPKDWRTEIYWPLAR